MLEAMDMRVGVERRRVRGRRAVVHAVPAADRTRSAVCGSSVRRTAGAWTPRTAGPAVACPDCLALLRPTA